MKKILGLDLGTTSIGWAMVQEAEHENETSDIIQLGVRIIPLSSDEITNFEKGKKITTNADRTAKRSSRRGLQRFKLRRNQLKKLLIEHAIINEDTPLTEIGKNTTYQTLTFRNLAPLEQIPLEYFAKILFAINKKRGFKSSRKAKSDEVDGEIIDNLELSKELKAKNLTPGQYCHQNNQKPPKDFYISDLQAELDRIIAFQMPFLHDSLQNFNQDHIKNQPKKTTNEMYALRNKALIEAITTEEFIIIKKVLSAQIIKSDSYLGKISDKHKVLKLNNITIGQFLYQQTQKNNHQPLKKIIFYRNDYLKEFNAIWDCQVQYYPKLTPSLKEEIKNCIFFQRKLKSQKKLISTCELETKSFIIKATGKEIQKGPKVVPKSCPLFQEFKIWQILNNIELKNKTTHKKIPLNLTQKELLYNELSFKDKITPKDAIKILKLSHKEFEITNYKSIEGDRTQNRLMEAYLNMMEDDGHTVLKDWKNKPSTELKNMVTDFLKQYHIDENILKFDNTLNNEKDCKAYEQQPLFQLWHLLYSYQEDDSNDGNENLIELLKKKFGFNKNFAKILSRVSFENEYGNLSTKAIKRILPFLKDHQYDKACEAAGYKHSKHSLTTEEIQNKIYTKHLPLINRNSLRNPVVEKIVNQMIHLVNTIIEDPNLGKPDEIRIELARELKKNALEREELDKFNNKTKKLHQEIVDILKNEFKIQQPSRNDIIRYKLYKELAFNGYKTLYSNTYIPKEKLFFDTAFDIDHIIPQATLYDDSFSNKTLEKRDVNITKGNRTAADFIFQEYGEDKWQDFQKLLKAKLENKTNVENESLQDKNLPETKNNDFALSKSKIKKLLMQENDLGEAGFIERDLRETQFITKKAKELLSNLVPYVIVSTGSVTAKLREDWGLLNLLKELNFAKYQQLGLTENVLNSKGQPQPKIKVWTKRDDHRHHAMDALVLAFTTHNHVQYINFFNARKNENHKQHNHIFGIEKLITEYHDRKRLFKIPFPNFRETVKKHLEATLIAFKAQNKVVTPNKNKPKNSKSTQIALTPRGQLHKETIYGKILRPESGFIKINDTLKLDDIQKIKDTKIKNILLARIEKYQSPELAFNTNNLKKDPILIDPEKNLALPAKIEVINWKEHYTICKPLSGDTFKNAQDIQDKVVDEKIKQKLLERLAAYDNNCKKAFSNLENNPIYFNETCHITIKNVTIFGVENAEALHFKKDHLGRPILDASGNSIPIDFVQTGNNHHIAFFEDPDGNWHEQVVSFFEATKRANLNEPIIHKNYNQEQGWRFLFSLKINETFLLAKENFNPHEIDLFNLKNYPLISQHLYRVQTISTKYYTFRHHLETQLNNDNILNGTSFVRVRSLGSFKDLKPVKVRVNHIGKIVQMGEV